ncbi:HNH endonuclease [Curtobacterium sp. MCPF17_003]|uniref:HNH endonuclease signature motif containing protein n=1 Tax=Curtobacterium sp. MCPF17_003 TaxID=2175637 RepID=UPI000DA0CB91|nr:HNH endonuclease signature motif containing protein [Curtobacterium sp. MCPF17_003]PYY63599.1 HNH endonuclease [Curtobacterium sp. MCPF17_003]
MQPTNTPTLPDKFAERIDVSPEGNCWRWTGYLMPAGYGQYTVGRRHYLAHRIAYELLVGPIPAGMFIDHRCFNRACVNPEHLRAVTNKQNMEHLRGANMDSSTGMRNVYRCREKWRVQVGHNGRVVHGGVFVDQADAVKAAAALRAQLFTHDDGPIDGGTR